MIVATVADLKNAASAHLVSGFLSILSNVAKMNRYLLPALETLEEPKQRQVAILVILEVSTVQQKC